MKRLVVWLAALGALGAVVAFAPGVALAGGSCGDGVVDANEECDGGGSLFLDGDPAKDSCSTGSRCYFQFTCCKFNCQYVGTPGAPCQDGDTCTGPDTCNQVGECLGGPGINDGSPCDDGLFCTGAETCQDGQCVSAGDPCPGTACNQCQEDTDSCLTVVGAPCSSGDTCVTGGTCDGSGSCVGGVFNNEPCDDGLFCNGADSCDGGACRIHAGSPCTGADGDGDCMESCDEATDSCVAPDVDGSACDDGQFCNGPDDTCVAGACLGTGVAGCDDDNSCTTDSCDEVADSCSYETLADGTFCSDGDLCTLDDLCEAGQCVGDPSLLDDLCPWTVVLAEHPRRDLIRTYYQATIGGDVCGGTIRFYGQTSVLSDLVADEAEGEDQLQLAVDVFVGDTIASAGGGAQANPRTSFLPYLDGLTTSLEPLSYVPKSDGSGSYDLTGADDLVSTCHRARTAFLTHTSTVESLASTATLEPIRLRPKETTTIAATNVGGVNVVDVDGQVKVGDSAEVFLDGGGDPDTVMVLRIRGRMKLLVNASLTLTGGLKAENTLVYVQGRKCLLNRDSIGAGTLVCSPGRLVARQNVAWIGAIYADDRRLSLGQGSAITYVPFQGF